MQRLDRIVFIWIAVALTIIALRMTPTLNAGSSYENVRIVGVSSGITTALPVRVK